MASQCFWRPSKRSSRLTKGSHRQAPPNPGQKMSKVVGSPRTRRKMKGVDHLIWSHRRRASIRPTQGAILAAVSGPPTSICLRLPSPSHMPSTKVEVLKDAHQKIVTSKVEKMMTRNTKSARYMSWPRPRSSINKRILRSIQIRSLRKLIRLTWCSFSNNQVRCPSPCSLKIRSHRCSSQTMET